MAESVFKKVREILIGSHRFIRSKDRRRQSALLSTVLLVIFLLGLVMFIGDLLFSEFSVDSENLIVSSAAMSGLIIAYSLNRLRYFYTASILTILILTLGIFFISLPSPSHGDIGMLYFIVIPILFTSILLPLPITIIYVIVVTIGMVIFQAALPAVNPNQIPTVTTLILGVLSVLAAGHRNKLEKDRIETVKQSEEHAGMIVQNSLEGFLLIDGESLRIIDVNEEACRMFRAKKGKLINTKWDSLKRKFQFYDKNPENTIDAAIDEVLQERKLILELVINRDDKTKVICTAKFSSQLSIGKKLLVISLIDITEQREKEKELEFLATHDPLTGLPNRSLCNNRIERAIARSKRKNSNFVLLLLDIDDFKQVNDAFGHITGDSLIKEIGQRIKNCLREVDTVARLGGDEFAVILEELGSAVQVLPVIQKIQKVIARPIRIIEREISITLSFGITFYPQDGNTVENLIRYADSALYHAKSNGKDTHAFYVREMSMSVEQRLYLAQELRKAVRADEFFLEYQPQISLATGKVTCYEALIRWNHPEKGRMNPGEFLPVAEDTGIIKDIGAWVLFMVFKKQQELQERGITDMRLALNVAGQQLRQGKVLTVIREILKEIKVPPGSIEIELTENIIFRDIQESIELIKELQQLGLRVAMDDFGDGHSTLHHLTALPIDILKIDQKFARWILNEKKNEAVVRGMASIAADLNIDSVAEGIETKEQLDFFTSVGVNYIQGFYFSPPVSEEMIGKQRFYD